MRAVTAMSAAERAKFTRIRATPYSEDQAPSPPQSRGAEGDEDRGGDQAAADEVLGDLDLGSGALDARRERRVGRLVHHTPTSGLADERPGTA